MVAAGGVRTLINLGNNGNDECKKRAQQSLSRIAITMDPNIAFSGQKACDAVRPILALLEYDKTGMETFEGAFDVLACSLASSIPSSTMRLAWRPFLSLGLLALTNLASLGDAVRKRIYADKGFASIETLMFDQVSAMEEEGEDGLRHPSARSQCF